ncbi:MAG: DUF1330 domain-containing protein [Deltaproteobacteria bacterium]|nr:DUF1330 domain-containing protein [Deltaproteobacteria bacterium]
MSPVQSNPDEFKKLSRNPNQSPFIMLNLLKFNKEGGNESYAKYMKEAQKFVQDLGGRRIFLGKPNELLNGHEDWDLVLLVEYPSRKAFLKMANDPEYLKVHELRAKGIERAILYAMDPLD